MKKIFLLICTVLLGVSAFAQEVSLVTSGEGKTKDAATASALRSAIEQSYGVFVSANTTILNDDIVRDEVATVASGNIKSYKELSCVQNANGIYMVSVEAVVSIGKLISYAKAHGSSTDFAGQAFAMEIKKRELNKKNEYEALQNMLVQLRSMQDDLFDYEIKTGEPRKIGNKWSMGISLSIKPNRNYTTFMDILTSTLSSLSMPEKERSAYKVNDMDYSELCLNITDKTSLIKTKYYLRNNEQVIDKLCKGVDEILNMAQQSCVIMERGDNGRFYFPSVQDISPLTVYHLPRTHFETYEMTPEIEKCQSELSNLYRAVRANNERGFNGYNMYAKDIASVTDRMKKLKTDKQFFRNHSVSFHYTMEELSRISGYGVVRFPLSTPEDREMRAAIIAGKVGLPPLEEQLDKRPEFLNFADQQGIPYTVAENGVIKILLKKGEEIIIDFTSHTLTAPDISCEFEKYKITGSSCDFVPADSEEKARPGRIALDSSYVFIVIEYYDGNVHLNKGAKRMSDRAGEQRKTCSRTVDYPRRTTHRTQNGNQELHLPNHEGTDAGL